MSWLEKLHKAGATGLQVTKMHTDFVYWDLLVTKTDGEGIPKQSTVGVTDLSEENVEKALDQAIERLKK